jgi:hypothetical protein
MGTYMIRVRQNIFQRVICEVQLCIVSVQFLYNYIRETR